MLACSHPETVALFEFLEASIRSTTQRPRLDGRIAIGLLGSGGIEWWLADFRGRLETRRLAEKPEADALLLTTKSEGARWARGKGLSETPRVQIAGDRQLLDRFIRSFVGQMNLLAIRVGNGVR